jgi:hypothetical protein
MAVEASADRVEPAALAVLHGLGLDGLGRVVGSTGGGGALAAEEPRRPAAECGYDGRAGAARAEACLVR